MGAPFGRDGRIHARRQTEYTQKLPHRQLAALTRREFLCELTLVYGRVYAHRRA